MSPVTTEQYLAAAHQNSPTGRALAIHYEATNGTCAVCYYWPGAPAVDVIGEPWPCPTVDALMGQPRPEVADLTVTAIPS